VGFNHVVPVNDFIDRPKFSDSSFNLAIEPFNFTVGLGVFHSCDDMLDLMIIKEILEFVLRMFPISG
jgi:hypothetical protein